MGIYKPTYTLGDYVWDDANSNGIQDSGESGIANVTIKLYKDGVDTGKTATTDNNGYYEFTDLEDGDYYITVDSTTLPSGYQFTGQNQSTDDTIDSDVNSSGESDTVTISGADIDTLDVGLAKIPTYCLGDFIWYDDNENGIQDSGEGGVSGVKVTLNTGAITTTDGDGKYEFCSLDNGSYSVTVDLSTLPSGYKFTDQNQGTDDTIDSDINPTDGKSDTVTIQDANNTTLDGGIYKPDTPTYCLGDFIWYDDNENGIQDSGEGGVSGVKVTLNTGAITKQMEMVSMSSVVSTMEATR